MDRLLPHMAPCRRSDAVVTNSKALSHAPLRAVEFSGDFSQKAASGGVVSAQDPIRSFFDRLLADGLFEVAVLVAKKGLLGRKDQIAWPLVIESVDDAISARSNLEKIARSGFQLVVGTKSSRRDLEALFESLGYRKVGQATYGSGSDNDPARAAWDKESLQRAVVVAARLCDRPLCVFAHDGDPVYLLERLAA
jgi:hypothetical protein